MLSESTLNLGDAPPTAPHRSRGMYIAITKKQDEGMPSRCVSGQFVLQQAPRSELCWDGWDAPWEVSSPNRSCPPPLSHHYHPQIIPELISTVFAYVHFTVYNVCNATSVLKPHELKLSVY